MPDPTSVAARDQASILAANRQFYEAFASGDVSAMEGLWVPDGPVACIHPGWPPLTDRTAILRSWREIMMAGPPPVRAEEAEIQMQGPGVALVLCREVIGSVTLAASNLFRQTPSGWKLAHHQASPLAPRTPTEAPKGRILH